MSRIPESWQDIFKPNGEPNLISSDLLLDMLKKVADESKRRVANCRAPVAIWEMKYYPKLVKFVYNLVTYLNIDEPYVRYNTCDLFEKFQQNHISIFKGDLLSEKYREMTLNRMKDRALLRLINCIMLSTKINSTRQIKILALYAFTMRKFGQEYSRVAIVKSEEYVMETVDYEIDQCPLYTICPLLIMTLVYNDPSIKGKLLFSVLNKTMDHYYLAKSDIMMKIFDQFKESKKINFDEFKCIIADSMLISCAIVAVTPMLVDEQSGPQVLEELVYITCYSLKDIELIRDVILEGIRGGKKKVH